jgi:hypothetical protein
VHPTGHTRGVTSGHAGDRSHTRLG